jgi:hypothetical protein
MLRIVLIYGAIAGSITIGVMTVGYAFSNETGGNSASMAFGYLIMLVALSMIFLGVRKHRNENLGGAITFWPAFGMGVAIASVAGVFYIIGWETYLAVTDYKFIDQYTAGIIERHIADGGDAASLAELTAKMEAMKVQYANPFYRVPITFTEIFPVGVIVSLISAALLRNHKFMPTRL